MVHEGREREGLPDRSPGSGSADANLSGTPPGAANLNITLLSDTISSHSSGGSSRHDRTESDIHTDITSSRHDRTEASAHTHHKADEVISARIAKSHRKEHGSADENDHKKDARSNRSTKGKRAYYFHFLISNQLLHVITCLHIVECFISQIIAETFHCLYPIVTLTVKALIYFCINHGDQRFCFNLKSS